MRATLATRIGLAAGLLILGILLGRFSANFEIRIQSRHSTEDFSRFMARVDSGDVREVTFIAPGEVNYVTGTSQMLGTNLPPDAAQWVTRSLLDRGVTIRATANAAR